MTPPAPQREQTLEERGRVLTQQVALSIRCFLGQEVGEKVLEIAGQPHTGHGNADVSEIFLHLPFAIKVACRQFPRRQLLDILQAAIDHIAKAQTLGQIGQQLSLVGRKRGTTKLGGCVPNHGRGSLTQSCHSA